MKKMMSTRKRVLFIVLMAIIGAIFVIGYLSAYGNTDQVYDDIIAEFTSAFLSNKSAERNLVFILCFLGMGIYSVFYFITKKEKVKFEELLENQRSKEFLCTLLSVAAVYLIVYGDTIKIVFAALIFAAVLYVIDKELLITGISVYFLSIYTYIAVYRIYVYCGGKIFGNNMTALLVALVLSSVPLIFTNKKIVFLRLGLLESMIVPFALLIFLANKYKNGEAIVKIDVSIQMSIFIWGIIITFVVVAIVGAVKKWKTINSIEDVIRIGTCITIMAFNRYDGTGAIMSADVHHPFENIIGYSQIVDLGRIPFKNYIPVSGMYSIIQGAIFDWFGDGGTFANYNVTNNLFYLIVIIGIVWLIDKQVDRIYVFLISLVFYVLSYNRLVFVLPIMLLLIWPKLVEKKNIWLMVWFLTSLFQGLYYPLYGVATCVGFFPMGLWQVVTYIKSGELKKDICTIRFWIGWGFCLGITLFCVNFLTGTLKHMLAMSGQSVLADGISRFGQLIPSWFFGYLGDGNLSIRLILYYIFTFLIPALFVWVTYAICLKEGEILIENKKLKVHNAKRLCSMLSIVIFSIICYTFTVIRLDIDSIYARSTGVLLIGMVMVLVLVLSHIKEGKLRLIVIIFVTAIPAVTNRVGVFATEANSKLQSYYVVPENYTYVESDPVDKIGIGFIEQDIYNAIVETDNKFKNCDKTQSYYGDPAWFGYYYLLGLKGDGSMEIASTVKSFSAAQESVDIIRENHSIVGLSYTPYNNYYLYYWLLASGEYYWNAENMEFMPNDGLYTKKEIIEQNKNNEIAPENIDLGKTANAWGESMDSLEKIFSRKSVNYNIGQDGKGKVINFEKAFLGEKADFVYLDFGNLDMNYKYTLYNLNGEVEQQKNKYTNDLMKKDYNSGMSVRISWKDENNESHLIMCNMSKGKLLIPVGAGAKWLFNKHSDISIHVFQDDVEVATPNINEIKFLKLREVN